jgi:hypothetical protein
MRTLTSTLLAAQQAVTKNPLYRIVLTKGATTYTYEKDRILPSKHDEEMYSQKGEVVLDNADGELNDLDLKGYDAVISYGFGSEYSAAAALSAIDQQFDSTPDKLNCTLFLEGIPNLMAQDEASENYIPDDEDTKTVKDLVNAIAGATLDCFDHCKAYQVVWDVGYDTLADTYKSKDGFRVYTGGSRLAALRRVLDFTANVPRFRADGKIHILKPVTTGTAYDSEYSLAKGSHTFFHKAYKNSLVFPNRIVITSRPDDDPQYSGSAQIDGYSSLPDSVKKTKYIQARLESNAQAEDIAEALIAKAEMGCSRGHAEVPLNCGAEVFDYVKVTDSRQGDTRTGNLGYVHRRFGQDKWTMTFGFGNWFEWLKYQKMLKELETYTGQYFERLSVDNLYAKHIYADSLDMVWIDPEGNIDLDKIGDTLDHLPDGEIYARVKSLHLDAGQIKLDEHVWYKAGYDPSTKWTGSDLDDLPDGVVYQRVKSAALTADGLVILDQVVAGTYGLVMATDISAGHILLSTVVQSSSYQTATSAQKTAWTAKPNTMDQVGEGTAYQRVKTTEIDSGRIKLTAANYYSTKYSGKWYYEGSSSAGVSLEAGVGINIWGRNNALTTRATETDTIQCYVGSDGAIYAGAGAVKLNSTGVTITGEYLKFDLAGTTRGKIYVNASHLVLAPTTGWGISLVTDYNIMMTAPGVSLAACNSMILPQRSTAPTSPAEGTVYYNTTNGLVYLYTTWNGPAWKIVSLS